MRIIAGDDAIGHALVRETPCASSLQPENT
jgi:hypothetical protein